jgi:hypothetical protein
VYDNDAFIVESFLDEPVKVQVATDDRFTTLTDLDTNQTVAAGSAPRDPFGRFPGRRFDVTLPPHSYRVFQARQ